MSTDTITIELKEREIIRKKLAALRNIGEVPVVVHDHGKPSMHASGPYLPLEKIVSAAGRHHPIEVQVAGESRLVLIRDIDYDPRKNQIRHIVFQSIRRNEKTHAEIPILFSDDIPAERASLMVIRQLDSVEVEALPKDLPDSLSVDPAGLVEVGDSVSVADITAPKGVTILTELNYKIATVEMPKDQLAEADAAAESLAEDAELSGLPDEEVETDSTEAAEEAPDEASTEEETSKED